MKKEIRVLVAAVLLALGAAGGHAAEIVRERTFAQGEFDAQSLVSGGVLVLPDLNGGMVRLSLGQRNPSVSGRSTFCASVAGSAVRATVVETAKGFVARVPRKTGRLFLEFRCRGSSLLVREVKAPTGRRAHPKHLHKAAGDGKTAKFSVRALTGDPMVDGRITIKGETLTNVVDIMVAFDKSAATWVREESVYLDLEDAIELFAAERVEAMNADLKASGIGHLFSFRLVGIQEMESSVEDVLSPEGDVDLSLIHDFLIDEAVDRNPVRAQEWKAIMAKREELGADLVSIMVLGSEEGLVGIGTGLDNSIITGFDPAEYIYNVCAVNVVAYDHTMTHECAHNMGAGHAKMYNDQSDGSGPQLYDYSMGHYFDITNSEGVVIRHCATIMAYNDCGMSYDLLEQWREYAESHYVDFGGSRIRLIDSPYYDANWASGLYEEIGFFSSPNVYAVLADTVTDEEFDTGVPTGTEEHDNVRILSLTYPYVANYYVHRNQLVLDAMVGGSVAGSGGYPPGAKVKLQAVPEDGYVFAGWYSDENRETPAEIPGMDYRTASGTMSMPDAPMTLYAKFITAEEDARLEFNDEGATFVVCSSTNIALSVTSGSAPKVTLAGLPDGLKFDQGSLAITGTPTKPDRRTVTVSMTNATITEPKTAQFTIVVPNLVDEEIPLDDGYGPFVPGVTCTTTIHAAAGCSVKGLPDGLKWTASDIAAASANSVYGVPTKPGVYTVYFTKTVEGVKHTATATFTVSDLPKLTLDVAGTGTGKVTGAGSYLASKKIALKATPDSGCVFMGWYDGDDCISQLASFQYVIPCEDKLLTARFVTSKEDAVNISAQVESLAFGAQSGSASTNVMCGVRLEWPVAVSSLSAATVKVAGLPTGLKFTAKDIMKKGSKTEVEIPANTIYGAPSAASAVDAKSGRVKPSEVKITVTTSGKSTANYLVRLTVDPLPAWAVGNFEGSVTDVDNNLSGLATMSVTAAGKVSGKHSLFDESWTYKADSYSEMVVDGMTTNFVVSCTATSGKLSQELLLTVSRFGTNIEKLQESAVSRAYGRMSEGELMYASVDMRRLVWSDKGDAGAAGLIAEYAGVYTCYATCGDNSQCPVTFTLDEKGAIKGSVEIPAAPKSLKATFSANALANAGGLVFHIYIPADVKKGQPATFAKNVNICNYYAEPVEYIAYRNPGILAQTMELNEGSGASGTVSVSPKYGQVDAGKVVTLVAKANNGSVFSHWNIEGVDVSGVDVSSPTLKFAMPGGTDVQATAVFVTAKEDAANIGLSVGNYDIGMTILNPDSMAGATNYAKRCKCGVALNWEVTPSCLSLATVKAANLPSGLKFAQDKKTGKWSITGVPSKAETKRLAFTVTTAGKASDKFQFDIEVEPIPAWGVGSFDGAASPVGLASLTIAANGKISGKILKEGAAWTLSAPSFDSFDEASVSYLVTLVGKSGNQVETNDVAVSENGVVAVTASEAAAGWVAFQNLWKRADTKAKQPVFKKDVVVALENGISATFKKDGVVSFAGLLNGTRVSGTSQLVWDGKSWAVTLYVPPKAPFKGFCETYSVELTLGEANAVTGVSVSEQGAAGE